MPSITPNLRLSITNRETNKPFLNWRLGIDGPDDSNMIKLDTAWGNMKTMVDGAMAAVGHAYTAATVAEMTDHDKAYVYLGEETGYTAGNWYYWNEDQSEWVSGGVYNATALQTDDTLTLEGEAADAKAAGEMIVINGDSSNGTRINITTTDEDVVIPTMDDVDDIETQINVIGDVLMQSGGDGTVVTVDGIADGIPPKTEIVNIIPHQDGSGDPSSENVRPITGYNSINVYHTGKNLWGGLSLAEAFYDKTTSYSVDEVNKTFTYARRSGNANTDIITSGFRPNTQYTIILTASVASDKNNSLRILYTDGTSATWLTVNDTTKKTYAFVTTANKTIDKIFLTYGSSAVVTVYYEESGIFEGILTVDDFEAYEGETIVYSLENTIYGGNLNMLTGELEEIPGYIASYNGETLVGPWISSMDVYGEGVTPTTGAQVFDFGAEKTTYNLDPQSFSMSDGICNVWANCGSIQIECFKDIPGYIAAQDEALHDRTIKDVKPTVVDKVNFEDNLSATSHDVFSILDEIPDYWKDAEAEPADFSEAVPYLERKIETIPPGKSMIFVTDQHIEGGLNCGYSNYLINYVKKRIGAHHVLFGGDVLAVADGKYIYKERLGEFYYAARRMFGSSLLPTYGDHDTNMGNEDVRTGTRQKPDMYLPYSEGYKVIFGDLVRHYHWMDLTEKLDAFLEEYSIPYTEADYNDVIGFFKSVYYIDDDVDNIRYISLNCGQALVQYGGVYNIFGVDFVDVLRIQIDWLYDVLMHTPSNYDVVVLSHKASNIGSTIGVVPETMLSGLKCKKSVHPSPGPTGTNLDNWWSHKVYDFTNAPDVGCILQVNGHHHFDILNYSGYDLDNLAFVREVSINSGATIYQNATYGQIPTISTQTDSKGSATDQRCHTMTPGTVTEQCFDVITLTESGIQITRFGAGEDRSLTIVT